MSEENNNSKKFGLITNVLNKIKKIKHLDIILTVLFVAIILLIYFSTFSSGNNKSNANENTGSIVQNSSKTEDNNFEYSKEIENKLCSVISNLKDVGKVSVAVKLSGQVEYVYAYSIKTEKLENGTSVETKTPILVEENNKSVPLVLQTIMPKVESIVVIASGAKDTNVKLDILKVVEMLYNLPTSKIEIFVGN